MSNCVAFHTQIASIMEVLANAAVAEICKLVDDGYAVLRLEMSQSQKENKALKRKLQMLELRIARGCTERNSVNSRPLGVQCFEKTRRTVTGPSATQRRDGEIMVVDEDHAPTQAAVERDECADVEEEMTESLLIKEERSEEDRDPQRAMNSREERAVEWRAGSREKRPVEETQNKAANHTEELTEQHRTRRAVWEVSGLESALKTEPETERAETLQHTGCEQSTGRLHTSCPEYLMCERTSQLRTLCTQGAGETEADVPSCSYATESSSESLSIHSGLQSLPPTGKGTASSLSLGSLDLKPEAVMIDSASTEEEAEMHSAWTEEAISRNIVSQHRYHRGERERMEVIPGSVDVCPPFAQISVRDGTDTAHVLRSDVNARVPFHDEISPPKGIGTHRVGRREKLFICTYCGKAFNRPKKVEIHQRVHTGEKPFRCTLCGKWFAESGNLKKHQRVHTGEKPFSCTLCGKRFAWIRNLKTHQQRNHPAVSSGR